MKKKDVLIMGSGGHATVVIDILEEMGIYNIVGIVANGMKVGSLFQGYPIIGDEDILQIYFNKGITNMAMGIGGFKNNNLRKEFFFKFKEIGFKLVNAIHPSAIISKKVVLGEGVVVFQGVLINTSVNIGDNVIVATGASIDHETSVGSHTLVSAGVTVGANDSIGEGVLLALGSKVVSALKIENNILVGAGAVVVKDCLEQGMYLGVPAKLIK